MHAKKRGYIRIYTKTLFWSFVPIQKQAKKKDQFSYLYKNSFFGFQYLYKNKLFWVICISSHIARVFVWERHADIKV